MDEHTVYARDCWMDFVDAAAPSTQTSMRTTANARKARRRFRRAYYTSFIAAKAATPPSR